MPLDDRGELACKRRRSSEKAMQSSCSGHFLVADLVLGILELGSSRYSIA